MTWSKYPIEVTSVGTTVRVLVDCRSDELASELSDRLKWGDPRSFMEVMLRSLLGDDYDVFVREVHK